MGFGSQSISLRSCQSKVIMSPKNGGSEGNYFHFILFENLFKPRQRRLAVCMVTDFVSFIYNLKTVF